MELKMNNNDEQPRPTLNSAAWKQSGDEFVEVTGTV